ncbi:Cell division and transport-associated protein TolA [Paraburkholderia caribensis MBA4]|uniref:Cell division and transport-associated protein TolA n=1 Tax=Paraburkholderia caribensis MBA4 TaxID=1323664 RepID=A0A0P0R7M3_9BURK|nr:cell envelope integrity protein TolA [Paraburkholderia caribensis]ALL64220.1 Cell division and transport-associated protein TolA [Paraburkholderia caribensis MBA4]
MTRQKNAYPLRPPRERGTWRAFALAALMHVLLGFFLYHGIHWQNSTPAGAEAELWTEVPDVPTPRVVVPPPAPVKPAPQVSDEQADIALQEKKRKQQEAQRQAELAEQQRQQKLQAQQEAEAKRQQQLAADQAAAAAAAKLKQQQQQQADKLKQQQLAQQKQEQLKKQQEEQKEQQKEQEAKQAQADAQAKADAAKAAKAKAAAQAQAAEAAKKLDADRRQRLAAMQGMAGGEGSTGNGLAKSGTGSGAGGNAASPGYAEKVQRRVRPNIIWSGDTSGLQTVVSVRCSPTGTLLSATVTRSSGNQAWDDAALRAVQRSDPMPQDIDGKTPGSFTITLRPAA